jgi:hypothetical protein
VGGAVVTALGQVVEGLVGAIHAGHAAGAGTGRP